MHFASVPPLTMFVQLVQSAQTGKWIKMDVKPISEISGYSCFQDPTLEAMDWVLIQRGNDSRDVTHKCLKKHTQ